MSEQIENVEAYIRQLGHQARRAASFLAKVTTEQKNLALIKTAKIVDSKRTEIMAANQQDVDKARANGLDSALLDRLTLTDRTIDGMVLGLNNVSMLKDPIGEMFDLSFRPSGIQVGKMRVPIGVLGMIYESRPNVTIDAAALALKSSNAIILRGGSEAFYSNQILAECIQQGLTAAGLTEEIVQVIPSTDRALVGAMIRLPEYIDVIIPRGGRGLVERISKEATVPVIKHLDGVCHVYIDEAAEINKAIAIAVNAKTHRYGTCNTMETLLIHRAIATLILPKLADLFLSAGVELRGCEKTQAYISLKPAIEADWTTEYLAPILSIKIVESVDEAIAHINQYGSHHTDAIVTESYTHSRRFLREVDSSSVMINASTRFADGFEYGLGAEIGISTDKFHVRGPVGLEGLTTIKWVVLGNGEIRE